MASRIGLWKRRSLVRLHKVSQRLSQFVGGIGDALNTRQAVALTTVVSILALLVPWTLLPVFILTPYSAVWVLAGLAAVSVTLLALLYAIAIFQGQQLAARLPSELVGDLFESRWHRAAFWRLSAILVTSLLGLAPIEANRLPISATNVVIVNILLLVITVLGTRQGIHRVFDERYPLAVLYHLLRRVDDPYLGSQNARPSAVRPSLASGVTTNLSNPFALIEQVCVGALKAGDLTTAHVVLRGVTGRAIEYLESQPFNARATLGWLGELLSLIARKAVLQDERTAEFIVFLFEDVIKWVLHMRLDGATRIELLQSFRQVRHVAYRERRTPVAEEALHTVGMTFKLALQAAPPENKLASLFLRESSQPPHDRVAELEWQHIFDDWLWELWRDFDLILIEDLPDVFRTGLYVQERMGWDVLEAGNLGTRQKDHLLRHLVWQHKQSIVEAVRGGRGEGYINWVFHSFFLDKVKEQGLSDFTLHALGEWSEVIVEVAKAEKLPWITLNEFAADGRGFAREGRDEEAILVAETLGTIAGPLSEQTNAEMRNRYLEAASALRSIGEWDQRETSRIKEVVEAQLREYHEEEKRLQDWRESLPSRRRIDPKQKRATPWA